MCQSQEIIGNVGEENLVRRIERGISGLGEFLDALVEGSGLDMAVDDGWR
jgi:hypothetical protein